MGAGSVDRTPHARAPQIGKSKRWRIRVSIPVPRRCERRTLPIELIPHRSVTGVGFEPTPPKRLGLKSNAFLARRERRKTNSATDTERPPRDLITLW